MSTLNKTTSLYVSDRVSESSACPFCHPHLLSHGAIRNQMHWLLVLQVPSTWVRSLPHQQADCVQLRHPILQAGSNVERSVSIVGLSQRDKNDAHQEGGLS